MDYETNQFDFFPPLYKHVKHKNVYIFANRSAIKDYNTN